MSTGPSTRRGKLHARFNALKSGIYAVKTLLPNEDAAAYEQLRQEVYSAHDPVGPIETALTEQIVEGIWRLQRLKRAEYAAFKRVETELTLGEKRAAKGKAYTHDDVDAELRKTLREEQRQKLRETALTFTASNEFSAGSRRSAPTASEANLPSDFTFLLSFGPYDDGRFTIEIDRKRDFGTRRLLQLHRALEEMRENRNTQTINPNARQPAKFSSRISSNVMEEVSSTSRQRCGYEDQSHRTL